MLRQWLRRGPSRAEWAARAALWEERCVRSNQERDRVRLRAIAAEGRERQERARCRDLEEKISAVLTVRLNEPERVEGCSKIRFHERVSAGEFMVAMAGRTGQPVAAFNVYGCKICPLSPVTMRRYWHVGHDGAPAAQAVKKAGKEQQGRARSAARSGGRLIEQRVSPDVLARLREMSEKG